MKIIRIICDEDIPLAHLLNDKDFQVFTAKEDDGVFSMTRRIRMSGVVVEKDNPLGQPIHHLDD